MCLFPIIMKNRKYVPNKKNKGKPSKPPDKRQMAVSVGCGKCIECLNQKKRQWQIRLSEELEVNKNAWFVTLTFSDEALNKLERDCKSNEAHDIAGLAIRRFTENWRAKFKKAPRHWLVDELGHNGTERLHIHGLIWCDNSNDIVDKWIYGRVGIGTYVNIKTVNYIVKYITKLDNDHKGFMGKVWVSKGIGSKYVEKKGKQNKYNDENTNESYRLSNGAKVGLPTYYRDKLYTEEEKQQLWSNKLDKEIRYVKGDKYDISTQIGARQYYRALEYQQKKNKDLGYGDRSWSKNSYKARRDIYNLDKGCEVTEVTNNRHDIDPF